MLGAMRSHLDWLSIQAFREQLMFHSRAIQKSGLRIIWLDTGRARYGLECGEHEHQREVSLGVWESMVEGD